MESLIAEASRRQPTSISAATDAGGRLSVLLAVCLAALVLPLSFSGAAMATHAIANDFGGSPAGLKWITNAFMLSFGSLLMAAGAFADEFGRKRVFTAGVALFALVSLGIGFAPNLFVFDLLRAVQGLAAAAALAGGSAALAQEFDGHARTRAFSMIGTTFGIGLAFGPILSGVLIETLGWRSIFVSGTVVGVAALVLAIFRMRESRDPGAIGFDWYGAMAFTAMLSLFTCALIEGPEIGWNSPAILGLIAAAILALAAFIRIEKRARRPLLDVSLFRYLRFVGVQVLPIATCYSYVVLLILLPLRFIGIEGYDEVHAGLLMMSLSAPMLVVPFLAASLTRRIPAGALAGSGLLLAAAGPVLAEPDRSRRHRYGRCNAAADDRHRRRRSVGIDGWPVGCRRPQGTGGHGFRHLQHHKVAGEGIALASVSAILAMFAQAALLRITPAGSTGIAAAAAQLATGDLGHATAALPGVTAQLLVQTYTEAFDALLYILMGITVTAAFVVFAFLGHASESGNAPVPAEGGQ